MWNGLVVAEKALRWYVVRVVRVVGVWVRFGGVCLGFEGGEGEKR